MTCPHASIRFRASVDPPEDDHGHKARLMAICKDCGERLEWAGVSQEPSDSRPYVDATGTELRAPLRVKGSGEKGPVM